MTGRTTTNYRFDEFQLDLSKRRLMRGGEVVPLKPRAFDVLAVLVENNGKLLSKDDLFRLVWGGQIVEETNLSVSISAIRKALGETASKPRYVTNVSGRGYYFQANYISDAEELFETEANEEFERVSVGNGNGKSGKSIKEPEPLFESEQKVARRRGSKVVVLFAASLLLVGLLVGSYFVFFRRADTSAAPFHALSVNRLTTTGRAPAAAISPDGSWFAYVQADSASRNSLWIAHIDGSGQLQIVAPTDKPLSSVHFAPDGSRVYFIQYQNNVPSRGTLFRVPVFGGVIEKINDKVANRVTISPDGKNLAFPKPDEENKRSLLVTAEIAGPEREVAAVPLTEGAFLSAISWSPDGKLIAVAKSVIESARTVTKIFTVRVADGVMTQVGDQGWYSVSSIVWTKTSDGIIAAIGEEASDLERQIWYLPLNGGMSQKLLADSNAYGSLVISADNSVMLAIQSQTISNIWVAPAEDLASAKQITFDMLGKQAGWNSLDWTDDGHIVFSGRVGKSDTIWEMNADGTDQRQIIPEKGRSQYLSLPDDGRFVVFTSNRSGSNEIWRADRNGSDIRQLTHGGDNDNPHVSPDGRYVVYHSGRGTDGRLFRISTDGGEPLMLIDRPVDWARFSPDGVLIGCTFVQEGAEKLMIIPTAGGEPVKTFDMPQTTNVRLSVRWTPDGKSITYRDWRNGIWKQDVVGGDPVRIPGLPSEKLFSYAWSRDGKSFAYARGTAISDVVLLSSLK